MKRIISCVLILLLIMISFSLVACQKKEVQTLNIGINRAEPTQEYLDGLEAREISVNEYLEQQDKYYRIHFSTFDGNQFSEEQWEEFDLLYNGTGASGYKIPFVSIGEYEKYFVDIKDELTEEGKLSDLYGSMPNGYWETVSQNGHIYSPVRNSENMVQAFLINPTDLDEVDVTIPDQLIGQPLTEWKSLFEDIYAANGGKGFLMPFTAFPGIPFQCGLYQTHFQLITPFLGIDYENPEKGVQCVYETEYSNEVIDFWLDCMEKGYLESNGLFYLISTYGFSLEASRFHLEGNMAYPVQDTIYNTPDSLNRTALLISQKSDKIESIYAFYNDLATDFDLCQQVTCYERTDGSGGTTQYIELFLSPVASFFGKKAVESYVEDNYEDAYASYEKRLSVLQEAPLKDFVFDDSLVKEEMADIDEIMEDFGAITYSPDSSWKEIKEDLVNQLYDAGMQKVMDEVNRQIAEQK